MTAHIIPFNPLDRKNLGASVAEAVLSQAVHPLGALPKFTGVGIYALYYTGDFKPYAELAKRNKGDKFAAPIYVGKAIPEGARKGGGVGAGNNGKALWKRLNEHATSIKQAENLDIADFHCRFLVVEDIWIPLGESLVIARYSPPWNSIVDGFGNHTPGAGRFKGMIPRWDVLHPGRPWALKCERKRAETAEDIGQDVENHLRTMVFPASDRFIGTDT
jgi:hypothetical protein